ncbi:MAG: hypothetical protein ACI8W7_001308 [Gammaproteobacteria bacterium]
MHMSAAGDLAHLQVFARVQIRHHCIPMDLGCGDDHRSIGPLGLVAVS